MRKIKNTLFKALLAGGREIRKGHLKKRNISFKNPVSLLTETDLASERAIVRTIKRIFPQHSILAEESGFTRASDSHKWIIDPLDGTTNFAHSIPHASVSIGYEEDGIVRMGGVYDPFRDELFFAEKNKGAFLNNKRIHVSKTKKLIHSLLVTGFPYDRTEQPDFYLKFLRVFIQKTQGIRRYGSAALDLSYTACGRFDGYWEMKLNAWDVAAGTLIVQEAGGKMGDYLGKSYSIYQEELLAANPYIFPIMLRLLKKSKQS